MVVGLLGVGRNDRGFLFLDEDLVEFDDNFFTKFVFLFVHISRQWICRLISIQIKCKLALFNLPKMREFQVIPGIYHRLIGEFGLIFLKCKYPQVYIILLAIIVRLEVQRYGEILLVNDILVGIELVVHVGVVGGGLWGYFLVVVGR